MNIFKKVKTYWDKEKAKNAKVWEDEKLRRKIIPGIGGLDTMLIISLIGLLEKNKVIGTKELTKQFRKDHGDAITHYLLKKGIMS